VIGIEGDGEAAGIKGDPTESVTFTDPRTGGPNPVIGTAHAQTDWIASVTGRLGWTWDRVMLYAKGGAAWAGDKYSADLPAFNEHIATTVTRPGWTVGGAIARGSGISVRELLAPGGVVRSRYAALHEWPTCEHTKAASGPRMS
jgi:hypothetical protein